MSAVLLAESAAVVRLAEIYRELMADRFATPAAAFEAGVDELLCLQATPARRVELLDQAAADLITAGFHPELVAVFTEAITELADL
jgi:hypothetical protein